MNMSASTRNTGPDRALGWPTSRLRRPVNSAAERRGEKINAVAAANMGRLLGVLLFLAGCDKVSEPDLPVASRLDIAPSCDLQRGCRAANEQLAVTVTFGTAPRALQPFPLSLRVDDGQALESATVEFAMLGMDMGQNRYRLRGDSMSSWTASITLPICTPGRSDWVADFEMTADGKLFRLQVPFSLAK